MCVGVCVDVYVCVCVCSAHSVHIKIHYECGHVDVYMCAYVINVLAHTCLKCSKW